MCSYFWDVLRTTCVLKRAVSHSDSRRQRTHHFTCIFTCLWLVKYSYIALSIFYCDLTLQDHRWTCETDWKPSQHGVSPLILLSIKTVTRYTCTTLSIDQPSQATPEKLLQICPITVSMSVDCVEHWHYQQYSILRIYRWIQPCKLPLNNFGLIHFPAIAGMKPFSCPSSIFCDNKGQSRTISRRKSYPINVLLWRLKDFCCYSSYWISLLDRLRTEAQDLTFVLLCWHVTVRLSRVRDVMMIYSKERYMENLPKTLRFWIHCNTTNERNSIPGIYGWI